MKIATAAYAPEWHPDTGALDRKLDAWVADAASQGAALLVFPEYAGIEAALIGQPSWPLSGADWAARMADAADDHAARIAGLAQRHRVHILAGSCCAHEAGQIVNRAWLAAPSGQLAAQDKIIPTPYERQSMGVTGGSGLMLIETALGRVGILICYDSEFPLLARSFVAAGADMLLVPSCTDQPAGQTRVRQSARARAIEGQCLVVQSPLVGQVPGCEVVDSSTGRAAIFCPPDYGLPPDGIVAQGATDEPAWVIADAEPAAIAAPRGQGQVGNYTHWPEQVRHSGVVTTLRLD